MENLYYIFLVGRLENVEIDVAGVKTTTDFEVIEIMGVLHIQITQLDKCRTYLSLVASVATPVQLVANVASWS